MSLAFSFLAADASTVRLYRVMVDLVAVDPSANSLAFCGFSGKPHDFPKS